MIIQSPSFCPEEFRTVRDVEIQLGIVMKLLKQRAYVLRILDLYLIDAWIEEVEEVRANDGSILKIFCTFEHRETPAPPTVNVEKHAKFQPRSRIAKSVSDGFFKYFESDFRAINGPLPELAVIQIRSKLDKLVEKPELAVT